jgi:enamine deaminase RidA (YjgF/YER057c/UK114 family)
MLHDDYDLFRTYYQIHGTSHSRSQFTRNGPIGNIAFFIYLQATTHLIPAKTYGVTSERGVALQFEDRRHIFISGTASIDAAGNIVEPGNIRGQTLRMWENVEVLLAQADATWQDVAQIIVYLRRQEDLPLVRALFTSRFPDIPTLIVMGKVCRPAWLIEMECMAIYAKG